MFSIGFAWLASIKRCAYCAKGKVWVKKMDRHTHTHTHTRLLMNPRWVETTLKYCEVVLLTIECASNNFKYLPNVQHCRWLCFRRSISLMWDRWECNRLRLVPVWGTDLSGVRGSSHQSLRLLCICW